MFAVGIKLRNSRRPYGSLPYRRSLISIGTCIQCGINFQVTVKIKCT